MTDKKTILLITGMHRSGTSLLGSIVESMGIILPGKLIEGDIYNIDGYYEREDIVDMQENLLIDMGRWWPTTYGCAPMPKNWLGKEKLQKYKKKLKSVIKEVGNNQENISAIKDPRISLLLPLWQEVCEELDIILKVIVSVRDPVEVINSLMNRDKEATGMTETRAEELWLRHNNELMNNISKTQYMLINYSDWFDKKKCSMQIKRLHLFCFDKQASSKSINRANSRINYKYRRSNRNRGQFKSLLKQSTRSLYNKLSNAAGKAASSKERYMLEKWFTYTKEIELQDKIYGQWFNKLYYKNQIGNSFSLLDLENHYNLIGWRKTISPNILFNPNHYKHRALLRGETVKGCPLNHFKKYGLEMNIEPNAIINYKWVNRSKNRIDMVRRNNIEGMHPWAAAAVAINNGCQKKGLATLETWLREGLKRKDINMIMESNVKYYSIATLSIIETADTLPNIFNVKSDVCGIYNWQLYSWIDIMYGTKKYKVDEGSSNILYVIIGKYDEIDINMLMELSVAEWIYCRSSQTCQLLNKLGISSKTICSNNIRNHTYSDRVSREISTGYGLPNPLSMRALTDLIVLGKVQEDRSVEYETINHLPNPNNIKIEKAVDARAISRWFGECCLLGIQLVWITDNVIDIKSRFWKAFEAIKIENIKVKKPELFMFPISARELRDEIAWRKKGYKKSILIEPIDCKFNENLNISKNIQSDITVCISLYNYESKIIAALDSIKAQTLTNIDLVIVNDCSLDGSLETAINWISNNSSRFNRVKVVSHTINQGLSTARNTGFSLSETDWIFVLDADNIILPLALESILKITAQLDNKVAAIYTLIRAVNNGNVQSNRPEKLMNFTYWNQIDFTQRNIIDAMATIKRSVWVKVGGYENIIGGWEDYDFWCKLVENEYCGIICPQILAEYTIHENSMITTTTSRSTRRISRQLQERHEWLSLPMANEHKLMMEE